jgi:hypothetical protein
MLPSRPPRKPAKPFPLVPLFAAGMITLGLAQLVWQWQTGLGVPTTSASSEPFNAVLDMKKRHANAHQAASRQPPRLAVPASPPLMVLKNPEGAVTLTIFADPAQASHRARLLELQNLVGRAARIELRYAPTTPTDTSIGMGLALARSRGLADAFWEQLMQSSTDTDATTSMELLGQIGIPLAELRATLTQPNPPALQTLNADLAWAAAYRNLFRDGEPMVLLEGYLIQAPLMRAQMLPTYIQRRIAGEPLLQPEDFL